MKVNEEKNSSGESVSSPRPAQVSLAVDAAADQRFNKGLQDYSYRIIKLCREEVAAFCDAVSKDWQATCSHEGMVKAAAVEYIANHLRKTDTRSRL